MDLLEKNCLRKYLLSFSLFVNSIYSEKATKFSEISTLILSKVKSKVQISQNIVAFSENMNFN